MSRTKKPDGRCADCGKPGVKGDDLSLSGQIPPFKIRCRDCRKEITEGRRPEHPTGVGQ